jgi:hypothetical protein
LIVLFLLLCSSLYDYLKSRCQVLPSSCTSTTSRQKHH